MTQNAQTKLLKRQKLEKRIWEIDFLRGFCILLLLWDHFWFLLYNTFGDVWINGSEAAINMVVFAGNYLEGSLRTAVHPFIVILFFLMCGISCSFSKSNLKRGILMSVFAGIISLVTYFLDIFIAFGAMHLLAASVLIWCLINFICFNKRDITAIVCFVVGTLIIFISVVLDANSFSIFPNDAFAFVDQVFASSSFYSADYWPIFPNAGFMLIGAALGYWLYRNKKSLLPILSKPRWYAPVNFMGRIGLWVYVLHQLVFGVILAAATAAFVDSGNWVFV